VNIQRIISKASNIKGGENPPFTVDNFKALYPHFFDEDTCKIPVGALNNFIKMADGAVKKSRYKSVWEMCMGLFIAHHVTLYMQSMVVIPNADNSAIAAAGQAKGLISSKSVDGVSIAYDYSQTLSDLNGWGSWKSTTYGVQFASYARIYNMGGMYIP